MSARAGINLASRPFVNDRPVQRVAILLWVIGGLLAITAAWSYWVYFAGRDDQRRELARLEEAMDAERAEIDQLQRRFAGFELDEQNQRVRFLNQRIAERTFSWSRLFDHLAGILPGDVRLLNLAPEVGFGQRRTDEESLAETPGERVPLKINATARREEAILKLLDALFASPRFEQPNLTQESRERVGGETRFTLTVIYLPTLGRRPATPGLEKPDAAEPPGAEAPVPTAAADTGGQPVPGELSEEGAT